MNIAPSFLHYEDFVFYDPVIFSFERIPGICLGVWTTQDKQGATF
jgi:hypothetical protein